MGSYSELFLTEVSTDLRKSFTLDPSPITKIGSIGPQGGGKKLANTYCTLPSRVDYSIQIIVVTLRTDILTEVLSR